MGLTESIVFAAIMALSEELEEERTRRKIEVETQQNNDYKYKKTLSPSLGSQYKKKLIYLAQEVIDGADKACETQSDIVAGNLVPSMICGIIYQALDSLHVSMPTKINLYEFSIQFCDIENDAFPAEFLFDDDNQFGSAVTAFSDLAFQTIFIGSSRGNMSEIGLDFTRVLCELMLYLENKLTELYPNIPLIERPSMIAGKKMGEVAEQEMQQMEDENPELKDSYTPADDMSTKIDNFILKARHEQELGNINLSRSYYNRVKEIAPNNWEAFFYTIYFGVYHESHCTDVQNIVPNTIEICNCISKTLHLAKSQLYPRNEIIDGICNLTNSVLKLATNYFVASMNKYKSSFKTTHDTEEKNSQVNAIIQMLFTVGDEIEKHFRDDHELCAHTACACWKIAFDCYESCTMPPPAGAFEHYIKINNYISNFQCSKPLTGDSPSTSEGCYIATSVYGSYDCPSVWTLRRFRDFALANTWFGRLFIQLYYAVSPTLVKTFENTIWFHKLCKAPLDLFVRHLNRQGYDNTPYKDKSN